MVALRNFRAWTRVVVCWSMFMRLRERKHERKRSILEVSGRMEAKACVTSRGSAPVKKRKGLIASLRLGCGVRDRRDICVAARPSIETEVRSGGGTTVGSRV